MDSQDAGKNVTPAERRDTKGLIELAEFLSLRQLRSQCVIKHE
jgi:hypothetical protein